MTTMKKALLLLPLAFAFATPAHATGGLVCRTAGANPIEVSVGFGHVAGAPLISSRLLDNGRNVPVRAAAMVARQPRSAPAADRSQRAAAGATAPRQPPRPHLRRQPVARRQAPLGALPRRVEP